MVRGLSAPRENVLIVPSRNVRLTGSGWGSGRTRSSGHGPARAGPVGGPEEGAKEADYAAAGSRGAAVERAPGEAVDGPPEGGRRSCRGARAPTAAVQPPMERGSARKRGADSLAGGVPRVRPDAGQRVPGQETQNQDRPRSPAASDDAGRSVAEPTAESGGHPRVASAPEFAGRVGAVGHQRTRLAGGPRREVVPDPHDRRRHEPTVGALGAQR